MIDFRGHDFKYAIDPTKSHNELGEPPDNKFANDIKRTINVTEKIDNGWNR